MTEMSLQLTETNEELQQKIKEIDFAKSEYERVMKELQLGGSPNRKSSIVSKKVLIFLYLFFSNLLLVNYKIFNNKA